MLQDAGIKLDSVASSIDTVSGLDMIQALIDGERRGAVLADLARGRMRAKIADLSLALEARFDAHHALICTLHLEHIAGLNEMIARLDAQVEQIITPFARQRDLLVTIPGIGPGIASVVISEIGAEVAEYFTTGAHLASWAGLCPGNHESAGKSKHGREGGGGRYRGGGKAYHRLVLRSGGYRNKAAKKKVIPAIAHTLILIIWHVLTEGVPCTDLGADFCTQMLLTKGSSMVGLGPSKTRKFDP